MIPAWKNQYNAPVRISGVDKPVRAVILQTGQTVPVEYDPEKRECTIRLVAGQLDPQEIGTIVEIQFEAPR